METAIYRTLKAMAFMALFLLLMAAMVMAQDVADTTVVVDESTNVEEWIDSLFKIILSGIGLFLAFAIRSGVGALASVLPAVAGDFVRGWMSEKRQADLHKAIMSQLSTIMAEGRWTGNAADFIAEIKRNILDSTPQAADEFGISVLANEKVDRVLANIANRKAIELQEQLSKAVPVEKIQEALGDIPGLPLPRGGSSESDQ